MLATYFQPEGLADKDFRIYFTEDDIIALESGALEGIVFRYSEPKVNMPLEVSVHSELGHDVEIDHTNNKCAIKIGIDRYLGLKRDSWAGSRSGQHYKYDLFIESRLVDIMDYQAVLDLRLIKARSEALQKQLE